MTASGNKYERKKDRNCGVRRDTGTYTGLRELFELSHKFIEHAHKHGSRTVRRHRCKVDNVRVQDANKHTAHGIYRVGCKSKTKSLFTIHNDSGTIKHNDQKHTERKTVR